MRKSFDGLSALVKHAMGLDPLSGRLFVFINRRATQMKVLYFDRSGFCVWAKRLEAGRLVSDWRQKVTWRPAQRPAATVVLKYVRPVIKRLAACRALEIEAEIWTAQTDFQAVTKWTDSGCQRQRAPVNHGPKLYQTLLTKGEPSRYVYYPKENHWVLKPQRSMFWPAGPEWFAEHNPQK